MKNLTLILPFLIVCFQGMSEVSSRIDAREVGLLRTVRIEGKTNVNKFYLNYENHSIIDNKPENLEVSGKNNNLLSFKIPTDSIQGRNEKILKDFRKLLKSGQFPEVIVEIDHVEFKSVIDQQPLDHIPVKLTLAGVERIIKAKYLMYRNENGDLYMRGDTEVHLSDFSLFPPKKFLGLVRVQDVIFITFDILINEG